MNGVTRDEPDPIGIGGVLRNSRGEVLISFSKSIGDGDSNEAEVLAILEALRIYLGSLDKSLIMENDTSNAISWVLQTAGVPWKFGYILNEIEH